MSKTIIEEHCKGRIDVSNTNEGALFCITLPKE
jgi:nitrogen fixation/metabolism regulation signal transduction histidine kinase